MAWIPSVETIEREFQHAKRVERNRLRDEFALAAMRGLILSGVDIYMTKTTAELAYEYADAMLCARERKEG